MTSSNCPHGSSTSDYQSRCSALKSWVRSFIGLSSDPFSSYGISLTVHLEVPSQNLHQLTLGHFLRCSSRIDCPPKPDDRQAFRISEHRSDGGVRWGASPPCSPPFGGFTKSRERSLIRRAVPGNETCLNTTYSEHRQRRASGKLPLQNGDKHKLIPLPQFTPYCSSIQSYGEGHASGPGGGATHFRFSAREPGAAGCGSSGAVPVPPRGDYLQWRGPRAEGCIPPILSAPVYAALPAMGRNSGWTPDNGPTPGVS